MSRIDNVNNFPNDGQTDHYTDSIILSGTDNTDKFVIKDDADTTIFNVDTANDIITANATITTGLTANKIVTTNGSSNLNTISYSSSSSANAIVQYDGSGNIDCDALTASSATISGNCTVNNLYSSSGGTIGGGGNPFANIVLTGNVTGMNASFTKDDSSNDSTTLTLSNTGDKGTKILFYSNLGSNNGSLTFNESGNFVFDKTVLPSGSIELGSSDDQWNDIYTKNVTIDDSLSSALTGLTIKNSGTGGVNFHMISANGTHSVVWNLSSNGNLSVSRTFVPNGTGITLGSSGSLWDDVYAVSGSVNTSDENKKQNISDTTLGLDFIDALTPRKFQFIENTSGRYHHGLISQEVKSVMDAQGISSTDFAGYIHDADENFYGLRYSEFISPMIKAIQELKTEIDDLKNRLDILENS